MNPQLKQSWIAALRSGRYHQGRGRLRERTLKGGAYFCAMGVLFDLIATPMQWSRLTMPGSRVGTTDEVAGYMPPEIRGEIGVSCAQEALIAGLHDSGKTFEQIADVIESDSEDEWRLRTIATALIGPTFVMLSPVLTPKSPPDWNSFAGIKPAAAVSPQQMKTYPMWT
jgi:hypothetical protein